MSFRIGLAAIVVLLTGCAQGADDLSALGGAGGEGALNSGGVGNGGAGGVVAPGGQLPCAIEQVLTNKCGGCHGPTPGAGVPMSLVTWADTQAMSITPGNEGKPIYQRIGERIHDPLNPMPPRVYEDLQLTPEELTLLDAWIGQAAPQGAACAQPTGTGGSAPTGGSGGVVGTGAVPGTGAAPSTGGGVSTGGFGGGIVLDDGGILEPDPIDIPVEPDPSECSWVELRARSDAQGTPYTVAADAFEQYRCFNFNIPEFAEQKTQGLAFYTINEAIDVPHVHHWLLYQSATPQTNGTSADCLGTHLDAALVAGWAPGATPWFLPEHVGIELGPNFILEVHYNNPGGPATPDDSGVRICTTTDLRPETASVSWLGSDFFPAIPPGVQNHEQTSYCTPQISEPIHILRTWPHMHLLGRKMRAKVIRGGGGEVTYHDEVFDFNYQYQYDTPIIINPGDSIETTCVFDNPTGDFVGFGQATTQEMCYNFTVAYPANRLVNALPSVHTNACLNQPTP